MKKYLLSFLAVYAASIVIISASNLVRQTPISERTLRAIELISSSGHKTQIQIESSQELAAALTPLFEPQELGESITLRLLLGAPKKTEVQRRAIEIATKIWNVHKATDPTRNRYGINSSYNDLPKPTRIHYSIK
jgi:hypothetical protein